jgi:hypothetical protein
MRLHFCSAVENEKNNGTSAGSKVSKASFQGEHLLHGLTRQQVKHPKMLKVLLALVISRSQYCVKWCINFAQCLLNVPCQTSNILATGRAYSNCIKKA